MKNLRLCLSDADGARLRAVVATIDREILRLHEGGAPTKALGAPWGELVDMLAVGPEPETRDCPVCKQPGRRAATRCLSCWNVLSPPVAVPRSEPVDGSVAESSWSRTWVLGPLAVIFGWARRYVG